MIVILGPPLFVLVLAGAILARGTAGQRVAIAAGAVIGLLGLAWALSLPT